MEYFEIRQQVHTVERRWLETIHKCNNLRVLEMTYTDLTKNNPDDYFELVRITHDEVCVHFTPIK